MPRMMTEHVLSKLDLWDSPSTSKFDHLLHCIQQHALLTATIAPVIEHVVSNLPSTIPSPIPHIEQHVFDVLKSFKWVLDKFSEILMIEIQICNARII